MDHSSDTPSPPIASANTDPNLYLHPQTLARLSSIIHASGPDFNSSPSAGFDGPDFNTSQPQHQPPQQSQQHAPSQSFNDFDSGGFDPNPTPQPDFAPPPPKHSFAPGKKTGPETNFRDGSGNDVNFNDDDDLPPF